MEHFRWREKMILNDVLDVFHVATQLESGIRQAPQLADDVTGFPTANSIENKWIRMVGNRETKTTEGLPPRRITDSHSFLILPT
jgi:hypothetical protein